MTQLPYLVSEEDLANYVLGELNADRSRAIEKMAAADEELAGQIAVLRIMGGPCAPMILECLADDPASRTPQPVPRRRFHNWRRAAIAALLFVAVAGVAWAGWKFISAPLLEDQFSDGWYDSSLWLRPAQNIEGAGLKEEKGFLRLVNRAYLVTQQEFPEPISVNIRWKWIDLSSNPLYADHLAVALRTSGKPALHKPYEASDGIIVRVNAWGGTVSASEWPHVRAFAESEPGMLPMPASEWHDIRITDDGDNIAVYIAGPAIEEKHSTTPVLRIQRSAKPTHNRVAIYNRELVPSPNETVVAFPHESLLDHVLIKKLADSD